MIFFRYLLTYFVVLFFVNFDSGAQDRVRVNHGANQWINAHSVCRNVSNASGLPLMVPIRNAAGWSSFYSNSHVGVTLSNPSCPAAGSVACNSPVNNQCGVYCGYVGTACAGCALPWGGSIAHGQSVTAYAASSVACGSSCVAQTRTCNNGSLSGTYTASSCSVGACSSCYPDCNAPGEICSNNWIFVSASASETIYASVGTGITTWDSFSCPAGQYRPSVSELQAFCSTGGITDGNGFWSSQEDGSDKAIAVVDGCGTYSGFKNSNQHVKCFSKLNEDCR